MTSYIEKVGDQLFLTLDGVRYPAVPTGGHIWLLNGVESGPGPGTPPTDGDQTFDWPFDPNTTVTSEYGPRDGRIHQGIDMGKGGVTLGSEIHASARGTVVNSQSGHSNLDGSGWGNFVTIDHGVVIDRQIYTLYAHMRSPGPTVGVGAEVTKGQVIGYVNNTGNSYGNHLHWETHVAMPGQIWTSTNPGTHINPRTFMATYQNVPVPEINMEGY